MNESLLSGYTSTYSNIAKRDKELLDLEKIIEQKKKQLTQDYRRLQRDVKENPYLQVALTEYKTYNTTENTIKNKKIKALSDLLQDMKRQHIGDETDYNAIKREIKYIKQKNT
jgi:hypothetical protein